MKIKRTKYNIEEMIIKADELCDNSIEIEEEIPPPGCTREVLCMKYPFHKLGVDHSFKIDNVSRAEVSTIVRSALSYYGKRLGHNYTRLKEGNGVRIWRIE